MELTPHFTLDELIRSQTATRAGIDNTPPDSLMSNLRYLAESLEVIRAILDRPIIVTSGYRCAALNRMIGGSENSRHIVGLAADFVCPAFGDAKAVASEIARSGKQFDQLIYEGRWIHFSPPRDPLKPKGQILTAHFGGPKVRYSKGLETA